MKVEVQKNSASATHSASQACSQQSGSNAHTVWQQPRSSQPGVPCLLKQSPAELDPQPSSSQSQSSVSRARWTQATSQLEEQQNGSTSHTASQQSSSEQRGAGLGTQQLGRSEDPHSGSGQASSAPLHCARANSAHTESHCSSQQ